MSDTNQKLKDRIAKLKLENEGVKLESERKQLTSSLDKLKNPTKTTEGYKFDQPYKIGSAQKRLDNELNPGLVGRFYRSINPKKSLGPTASSNIKDHSTVISTIVLFSLISGILTTIMYTKMEISKSRELILCAMALSWFLFLNFIFLIFEATRMFNVLLFISVMTLVATVVPDLKQDSSEAKLGISSLGMVVIPIMILSYYLVSHDNEEVTALKTVEAEKRQEARVNKLVNNKLREREKEMRERLTEDVESEGGIRRKIANAYIDALIKNADKNTAVAKKPDPKKAEPKKKEPKDGEDKDDDNN
jgi:hypothetical protein